MTEPMHDGQTLACSLKAGDMFYWEGNIVRVGPGGIGVGKRVVSVDIVDPMDRHARVQYTEQLDANMKLDLATEDDLPEGNCCDGFMHEGCEVWDCTGCPDCGCHHSQTTEGVSCPGLSSTKPPAEVEEMELSPFVDFDPEGLLDDEENDVWDVVCSDGLED